MSPQSMCNTLFSYVASEPQIFLNTQSLILHYLFTAFGKTKNKKKTPQAYSNSDKTTKKFCSELCVGSISFLTYLIGSKL